MDRYSDKNEAGPEYYMREALKEARTAFDLGEVPVGCVIVRDGRIIARGHNLTETEKDPTVHAEMNAIREASKALGGWRLPGCSAYVTCEPCPMCAGAMVWARIEELYIGADDPKAGACGSVMNVASNPDLNHMIKVERGILKDECSAMLKEFFRGLRSKP
ncbi:MAG: tRNA adenosine(34) deaminase TadA [Eubacterium sp.]|nr:tRNA adenosine(34) deaminase TadA [Eubacterium sp.]